MHETDRSFVSQIIAFGIVVLYGLGGQFGWWEIPSWQELRGPLIVGIGVVWILGEQHKETLARLEKMERTAAWRHEHRS